MKNTTNDLIQKLSAYSGSKPVASLYLPLMPDTELKPIVNSMLSQYKESKEFVDFKNQNVPVEKMLNDLSDRIGSLERKDETRTYALFLNEDGVVAEDYLTTEHESLLAVAPKPMVYPLAEYMSSDNRYLVLMVEREHAQIHIYEHGSFWMVDEKEEQVPQKVKRGSGHWRGYSGFRTDPNEHRIDNHIRYHLNLFFEQIGDKVFHMFNKGLPEHRRFDKVVIGTHDQLKSTIESNLHPYILERVVGWFDVNIDEPNEQNEEKAIKAIKEYEADHEKYLINAVIENNAPDGKSVTGLDEVRKHLELGTVNKLLISRDFLGTNILERNDLVLKALSQSADIEEIKHRQEDLPTGVAALLRYNP